MFNGNQYNMRLRSTARTKIVMRVVAIAILSVLALLLINFASCAREKISNRLLPFPITPCMIEMNHTLYGTNRDDYNKQAGAPATQIGQLRFWMDQFPIYAVKGQSTAKALCIPAVNGNISASKNYWLYKAICADSIQVNGQTVNLISNFFKDSQSAFPIYYADPDSAQDQPFYPQFADSSYTAPSKPAGDNNYYFNWDLYTSSSARNAILGGPFDTLGSGAVCYAVQGIPTADAFYIQANGQWYTVDKAEGYTGPSISDLLATNAAS